MGSCMNIELIVIYNYLSLFHKIRGLKKHDGGYLTVNP